MSSALTVLSAVMTMMPQSQVTALMEAERNDIVAAAMTISAVGGDVATRLFEKVYELKTGRQLKCSMPHKLEVTPT